MQLNIFQSHCEAASVYESYANIAVLYKITIHVYVMSVYFEWELKCDLQSVSEQMNSYSSLTKMSTESTFTVHQGKIQLKQFNAHKLQVQKSGSIWSAPK